MEYDFDETELNRASVNIDEALSSGSIDEAERSLLDEHYGED